MKKAGRLVITVLITLSSLMAIPLTDNLDCNTTSNYFDQNTHTCISCPSNSQSDGSTLGSLLFTQPASATPTVSTLITSTALWSRPPPALCLQGRITSSPTSQASSIATRSPPPRTRRPGDALAPHRLVYYIDSLRLPARVQEPRRLQEDYYLCPMRR